MGNTRITKIESSKIKIETEKNKNGSINLSNLGWVKYNDIEKTFKIGDIIYVKKLMTLIMI